VPSDNITAQALLGKGVPAPTIIAALGDPGLMKQLLSQHFSNSGSASQDSGNDDTSNPSSGPFGWLQ
jgi:archaellum biogenesis ATPase FlaH